MPVPVWLRCCNGVGHYLQQLTQLVETATAGGALMSRLKGIHWSSRSLSPQTETEKPKSFFKTVDFVISQMNCVQLEGFATIILGYGTGTVFMFFADR